MDEKPGLLQGQNFSARKKAGDKSTEIDFYRDEIFSAGRNQGTKLLKYVQLYSKAVVTDTFRTMPGVIIECPESLL